ncbi:MAG: ABC transporter ATP-binding protein/permease [Oculatellaceae cyanobacterium Prado106]|nr:ABC transporter ATP-binding protein/permease [Oculatellaceae cyanobacterium Prado106]
MIRYFSKFLYILGERRSRLLVAVLLFLLTSFLDTFGIGLVGPFMVLATDPGAIVHSSFLQWLYNHSGLASPVQFIGLFGLGIVLIFYIKSYLTFYVQKYILHFTYSQQGFLSQKLLHAYLSAPYTFHLNCNTSLLIQNITLEVRGFANGIMLPILNSAAYLIISFSLAILLAKTSLLATSSILIMLVIPFSLYQRYRYQLAKWGKQGSQANLEILRTINHSLGGFKETRIIGCEAYFEEKMDHYVRQFEHTVAESQVFKLLPRLLIEAVLITFLVGLAAVFLLSNQDPQKLTSILGVFAMASIRLIPAISQLTNAIGSLRQNSYALNKLYADLKELETFSQSSDRQLQISASKTTEQPINFSNRIVLDQVSYSYPGHAEAVLKDISLSIHKGEAIALIGRSGAGKTTLVDIILGLLTPTQGDIQVDGTSIYPHLRSWQNSIGYIPQSIYLMDDTLLRNIAFGVPDSRIDYDRVERALKSAQLTELIADLPQGLATVIGERGIRLSGGQRQRVGIARALYHEREILVLDEATAALDHETEKLVNDAIQSLSGTKTLIIIAHRLTTIEHCDRVYLLEKGRLVRSGSYDEVVKVAG